MGVKQGLAGLAMIALAACVSVPATPSGPAPSRLPSVTTPASPAPPPSAAVQPPSPPPATGIDPAPSIEAQAAYERELLSGWRTRAEANAPQAQGALLDERVGDFNGDGRTERAVVLVNPEADEYALFILGDGQAPVRLMVGGPLREVAQFGLDGQDRELVVEVGGSTFQVVPSASGYALRPR